MYVCKVYQKYSKTKCKEIILSYNTKNTLFTKVTTYIVEYQEKIYLIVYDYYSC